MSNSLRPHGLQHARLPCLSPSPRAFSNLCPLNRWSHPTNSSSVIPFSSCLQYLSGSEYFPMSQLFASGDQSIGASLSASVLPMIFVSASLHSLCYSSDHRYLSPSIIISVLPIQRVSSTSIPYIKPPAFSPAHHKLPFFLLSLSSEVSNVILLLRKKIWSWCLLLLTAAIHMSHS